LKNERSETNDLIKTNRKIVKEPEQMYAAWAKRINVIPYDKLLKIREKKR